MLCLGCARILCEETRITENGNVATSYFSFQEFIMNDSLILGIQCLQKTLNESFGKRERPQRETSTSCFITMW